MYLASACVQYLGSRAGYGGEGRQYVLGCRVYVVLEVVTRWVYKVDCTWGCLCLSVTLEWGSVYDFGTDVFCK